MQLGETSGTVTLLAILLPTPSCLRDEVGAKAVRRDMTAPKPARLHQGLARCPDLAFILDGTEHPLRRPQAEPAQREDYSGRPIET